MVYIIPLLIIALLFSLSIVYKKWESTTKYLNRRVLKLTRIAFWQKFLLVILAIYSFLFFLIPLFTNLFDTIKTSQYVPSCVSISNTFSACYDIIKNHATFIGVLINGVIAAAIIFFWLQERALRRQLYASVLYNFNETNRLLWQQATQTPDLGKCYLTQDDWASEDKEIYYLSQRIDWFEYVFILYDEGIITKEVWGHWGHYFKKLILTEPKFRELMLDLDGKDYYNNFFSYAQEIIDENDLESLKKGERLRPNPEWEKTFNKECLHFSKILSDIAIERNIEGINAVSFGKSIWNNPRKNIERKI